MNNYTHKEALDIVSRVIGLPYGEETYDVVDMNGNIVVVHHHNNAESQYSHLRGVVIDLVDEVMITKSALGAISPISIRDFKLIDSKLNKVFCGVEGTNLKIMKYKGTVYYVTNRRIYTAADKDKVIYVKYTMDILEKNPSKIFPEDRDTAPYYHEFILVNRHTSQLTTVDIPEGGFLVYVGTRIIDFLEYDAEKDTPLISATEFVKYKGTEVAVTSRYIHTNRDRYKPVSTIYPSEVLPNTIESLSKYIQYSREFCIVTYTDNEGQTYTVRVCHEEYLHRENILQFCDDPLRRYISLCRNVPVDNTRNRVSTIKKYLSKHKIYDFEDADSVLSMMKSKKRIYYINHRNKFEYCKNEMNTDKYLINTWIDMYNSLPDRNKSKVYDLHTKYTTIINTIHDLMVQLIDGDTVDCPQSVLEQLNKRIENIKAYSPKESAFPTTDEYKDHLINCIKRNIIQYTRLNDIYDMATALNLV